MNQNCHLLQEIIVEEILGQGQDQQKEIMTDVINANNFEHYTNNC